MRETAKNSISDFVKYNRNKLRLTQEELALKAGVGLHFVRDLEQGKETMRMDKVNQLLELFGFHLAPVPKRRINPYEILRDHTGNSVEVLLKNKIKITGEFIEPVIAYHEITGWKFLHNKDREQYRKSGDPKLLFEMDNNEIDQIENS